MKLKITMPQCIENERSKLEEENENNLIEFIIHQYDALLYLSHCS